LNEILGLWDMFSSFSMSSELLWGSFIVSLTSLPQ
jgi:hypothetical protein